MVRLQACSSVAFQTLLERYRRAQGKLLLVIEPQPDRALTTADLDLGLRYFSDLILCAEAVHTAVALMYPAETEHAVMSAEQAFAVALDQLQHPADPGQAFNPLAHVEVLAMGIGSPAWAER